MKTTLVMVAVLAGNAWAQPVPPQMVEESAEPPMMLGASGAVWSPSGDADNIAETSIGIRPWFVYRVKPIVALVASFDYILVNEKDGVADVTYFNINLGGRFLVGRSGNVQPYGEFLLGYHKFDTEGLDDSTLGFRFGGGIVYSLGDKMAATVGLNYSNASFDVDGFSVDVEAFILELGIGMRL